MNDPVQQLLLKASVLALNQNDAPAPTPTLYPPFTEPASPKSWTINYRARTISSNPKPLITGTMIANTGLPGTNNTFELRKPYVFNEDACERVAKGSGDQQLFGQFDVGHGGLRIRNIVVEKGNIELLLTTPAATRVILEITYKVATNAEQAPLVAVENANGVTVGDVLNKAHEKVKEIREKRGRGKLQKIIVQIPRAILVTAQEKEKIEEAGTVKIPEPSSSWLRLACAGTGITLPYHGPQIEPLKIEKKEEEGSYMDGIAATHLG